MINRHTWRNKMWLFIAIVFLTLVAISPFLTGKMPLTDDGNLHLYRVIALNHSIKFDGDFYPRYSAGLAYGYGSPLFNYFSPFAYYLPVLLHTVGLTFIQAWLGSMSIYIIIGAWGAYRLGSIQRTNEAGFIAAVAFIYSPYLVFDATTRGTITEVFALALLPHVITEFTYLAQKNNWNTVISTALVFALFIPIHNIVTLHGILLLVFYCLYLSWNATKKMQVFFKLLLAGVIAIGLTCFFWLPALGETNYIRLNDIASNLPFLDVTNHLRPISQVFEAPHTADITRQQMPIPISLSILQALITVGAILIGLRLKLIKNWSYILFWAGIVIFTVWMNLPSSAFLWENLPLFHYTQYAWRVLGIGSLALAILTSILLGDILIRLHRLTYRMALFVAVISLSILYSLSWTYRPTIEITANKIIDSQNYENQTGAVSLSSFSEYLPRWVSQTLNAEILKDRWLQGYPVARAFSAENYRILQEKWEGTRAELIIEASEESVITFDWLYMPSWKAKLDNNEIPVHPEDLTGFVSIEVPKGNHKLEVFLSQTSLQVLANTVSFLMVLLVIVLFFIKIFPHKKRIVGFIAVHQQVDSNVKIAAVVGIIIFIAKISFIDSGSSIFRADSFINGTLLKPHTSREFIFEDKIKLIGFNIYQFANSSTLKIDTFWTSLQESLQENVSLNIRVLNSDSITISQKNIFQIGGLDTKNWCLGFYSVSEEILELPSDLIPGEYHIEISLYNAQSKYPLDIIDLAGNAQGVWGKLDTVFIKPISSPNDNTRLNDDSNARFVDFTKIPEVITVGDEIIVELLWIYQKPVEFKFLWKKAGQASHSSLVYQVGRNSTATKIATQERHYYRIYVPPDLDAGIYELGITTLNSTDSQSFLKIAETDIHIPNRDFTKPQNINAHQKLWRSGIYLIGYEIQDKTINLYWSTNNHVDKSFHLFVQGLDRNFSVVSQTSGIPQNWMRITTSWLPNETIMTQHTIIEPDVTSIRIGWFNPLDNNQDETVSGDNYILIGLK